MPPIGHEILQRQLSRPCTLREACQSMKLDQCGARCPACPLKALCESDRRWLVPASPEARGTA